MSSFICGVTRRICFHHRLLRVPEGPVADPGRRKGKGSRRTFRELTPGDAISGNFRG